MNARFFTTVIMSVTLFANLIGFAEEGNSNVFNVRSFGAVGDGKHLDSDAINEAISAAAKTGGGTVSISAGIYLCGSIHLKSNIRLKLEAGSTILGAPQSMNAYDETETYTFGGYQDGGHCYFHNSLIWGENLTNVFIVGNGMINGGGLVDADKILDEMVGFNRSDHSPTNTFSPVRLGNKAIALKLCRNVLIRDITIYHGGHFAILTTGCDNLTMDNVTIDTDRDGIDIDCCRNTMVSNCRINAPGDDALCLKSSYALGRPRLTENLTIVNCQVSGFQEGTLLNGTMKPSRSRNGRIKFGTESSGGFRNCTVANCTFRDCKGLALEEVDGGIMENITINNLAMTDVQDYAIYVATGSRNRTPGLATKSSSRNIFISNVIADGVGKLGGIQLMGMRGQPIEGLRLQNIRIVCDGGGTREDSLLKPRELGRGYPEPKYLGVLPAYGVFARHLKNLELENVSVSFATNDFRPAAMFSDVDGLELDEFKGQTINNVLPAIFGNDMKGVEIRNSPGVVSRH